MRVPGQPYGCRPLDERHGGGLIGVSLGHASLLTAESVGSYLVRTGLLTSGVTPTVTALGGGVSNVVLAVDAGENHWVVKQSLPRLRVDAEWYATQRRTVHESRGLAVAAGLTPGSVPQVVHLDPERFVLVIERAPTTMVDWKRRLLGGDVDTAVAAELGRLLGCWHATTAEHPHLLADLDDPKAFEQLRIGPYHRAAAAAQPQYADAIAAVVGRMSERRVCLVHGDFSPKNVLTGAPGTWVIDFEVAHRGDPDFDVAFLLCHLLCKYVHLPATRRDIAVAGTAFLASYRDRVGGAAWLMPDRYRAAHLGALLVARVDGKSPVDYLDQAGRAVVRRLGGALLSEPVDDLSAIWPLATTILGARG